MLLQLRFHLGLGLILLRFGFSLGLAFGLTLAFALGLTFAFGLTFALGLALAFGLPLAFSLTLAFGLASAFGLTLLLHFTLHDSFPYRFLVQNRIPSTGLSLTQPQYSLRFHVKHNPNPLPCILQ